MNIGFRLPGALWTAVCCAVLCPVGAGAAAAVDAPERSVESAVISRQVQDILKSASSKLSKIQRPLHIVVDEIISRILLLKYGGRVYDGSPAMDGILQEILVSNRLERLYSWKIRYINDPDANVLAAPNGSIYVFDGMLRLGLTEEEFAGILAHEIAHTLQRHTIKKLELALGASAATLISSILLQNQFGAPAHAAPLAYVAELLLFLKMSRDDEGSADALGVQLLLPTPFACTALSNVLEKATRSQSSTPNALLKYFQTHPPSADRIQRTRSLCAL